MKQTNLLKGLLAIVVMLCSTHSWAYDFEVDNIQYTVTSLDELTAEVSGLSHKSVAEVVIPETVEYKSRTLTVTSIGGSAFYSCTGLESVTIPNSVTSIGISAFSGCSGLTEVSIPNSIASIGNYAFADCIGLTGTLTIPNNVIEIGDYSFSGCSRLTEVTIGESVATIGDYAFSGCTKLTEVTIGESMTKIGNYAFQSCAKLTEVNFNATSCSSAGSSSSKYAFNGCTNLSAINLGDNVTRIPSCLCCNCASLTEVTIPNSVTEIGSYAFYNCTGLTQIAIGNSVKTIGSYAFYGCTGLTEITIPNSVTSIDSYAFYDCSSFKELTIPNSVTSLGYYALEGCTNLECFQIGTGMDYLCDYHRYDRIVESTSRKTYGSYEYYYPVLWKNGPSSMESIILKDGTTNFSVRGYAETKYTQSSSSSSPLEGRPTFSNINVEYYYVGRPLIDIDNWYIGLVQYKILVSQPNGTIKTLEIGGYCTDVPYFYQRIYYLILGGDVATYTVSNIYQNSLNGIICRGAIPPTVDGTFNDNTLLHVPLYVPQGSRETYEATEGWKDFWEIIELDDMPPGYDAVESVTAYGQADVIGYYSIDGKKVSTPQRGINIIRYSDGTTRKVLIK